MVYFAYCMTHNVDCCQLFHDLPPWSAHGSPEGPGLETKRILLYARRHTDMAQKNFLGEFEQMVLLAILQKGDKAYGVEVRREIEECAGRRVTRGAFYTTLDRLETKGYLRWTTKSVEGWRFVNARPDSAHPLPN